MSMLMVRPGPLEGGPMVSPGPAKESGEPFSAHLKQAFDQSQGASAPVPVKPVKDQPDKELPPAKETAASPKEVDISRGRRTSASPSLSKGKGLVPTKGAVSSDVAETGNVDPSPSENSQLEIIPIPANINLAVENILEEMPKTEGETDVCVPPQAGVVVSTDLSAPASETPNDSSADPTPEKKEEPAKSETKPLDAPAPVPLLTSVSILLPTETPVPVKDGTPQVPVQDDSTVAPVASTMVSHLPPVLEGPKPVANSMVEGDKEIVPPVKMPELKKGGLPKDQSPLPKKKTESLSVPVKEGAEKTLVDLSDLPARADPSPKIRVETTDPVAQNPDKEVRPVHKDTPPMKEAPVPVAIIRPDVVADVPLTTDAVPKLKETPGIAPVHSGTTAQGDVRVLITTGPTQNTAPVLEGSPAKAGPVVTPSPVDLARQIHVHLDAGRSVVRIDLHPEHLGELRISMEAKGKDVSMQFTVDNDNARTAVVAGLREITGTLSNLGWSVSGLAVNVSSGGVGNGRGESSGPLWGQGKNISNTLPTEPDVSAPKQGTGEWRVDLVA